jgi:hypothetical protein
MDTSSIAIYLLLFSAAIVCDAVMDHINFHRPHNKGYWSLHYPYNGWVGVCGWHDVKKLRYLFIIVLISVILNGWTMGALLTAGILAVLNYIIHETVFNF